MTAGEEQLGETERSPHGSVLMRLENKTERRTTMTQTESQEEVTEQFAQAVLLLWETPAGGVWTLLSNSGVMLKPINTKPYHSS
ncbi:hypothetical protein EYF80_017958 [Liparis tanakae]|uniref:Uncharacterized protein n=1 Tax=Liparis tanakae TaxID=230148 RepID=A0A4Z2I1E6_9TELE|nr:hypothetical protein EYF80_017958 [Liparis tanakae]